MIEILVHVAGVVAMAVAVIVVVGAGDSIA